MRPRKTVRYTDELHDDFAGTRIQTKTINGDFPYSNTNPLWQLAGTVLYRVIATPIAFAFCHIRFRVRVKNRRALRRLRKTGYFLYANHTQAMHDAFEPSMLTFPKRCNIITSADTVSIPGLKNAVLMLGAIPIPGSLAAHKKFRAAVADRIEKREAVMIYPEAHIWPYYTGVREFPDDSFSYPVQMKVPAVAVAVKYRARKFFGNLPPYITVIVSDPMLPRDDLSPQQARAELRNRVFAFLKKNVCVPDNAEYIRYIREESETQSGPPMPDSREA